MHDEVNNNEVTVYRGSSCKTVHIRDLVVGDLIQINQGDRVPADCLLIEEHFMFVDETLYDKNRYDVEKETSVKYRKGSFQQKFKPDNHHLNVDPFLFCDSKVRVGQGKAIVLCVG